MGLIKHSKVVIIDLLNHPKIHNLRHFATSSIHEHIFSQSLGLTLALAELEIQQRRLYLHVHNAIVVVFEFDRHKFTKATTCVFNFECLLLYRLEISDFFEVLLPDVFHAC